MDVVGAFFGVGFGVEEDAVALAGRDLEEGGVLFLGVGTVAAVNC